MSTTEDDLKAAYYARIVPVLGAGLGRARIAVVGVAGVAGVVERLAGCRAVRWWIADDAPLTPAHPLVRGGGVGCGDGAGAALAAGLRRHNAWEDGWAFTHRPALTEATFAALAAELQAAPPDLLLAGGDGATLTLAAALARRLDVPALLVAHCAGDDPLAACLVLLPGEAGQGRDWTDLLAALGTPALTDPAHLPPDPAAWLAWTEANGVAALLAKALLTHGTPHAALDLDRLLWRERRTAVILGSPVWPWTTQYVNLATAGQRPARGRESGVRGQGSRGTRYEVRGTNAQVTEAGSISAQHSALRTPHSALVIGCGSLGSLVARELAASHAVRDLVLLDGDTVGAANPVRQFFHTDQVGQPKALALARNLAEVIAPGAVWTEAATEGTPGLLLTHAAGRITALAHHATVDRAGLAAFRRVLRAVRPGVVVLVTGSQDDYRLARVLRTLNIPHVVGRCYPRARYFEAIVVDGRSGPCFGCLRGHLYTGPAPPLTPEEALRYDRPPAPGELQAEPATVVESGRAADVLARFAAALAAPRRARPAWLAALLASEQTCLIGGTTAQPVTSEHGPGWAYGVRLPGQVVAFGPAQVLGVGLTQICPDCGRRLDVRYEV